MPIFLKSANLNLLEPSGPAQARKGIALPIFISYYRALKEYALSFSALKRKSKNILFANTFTGLLEAKFAVITITSFIPRILSTAQSPLECGVFGGDKVFCITRWAVVFFRLKLCV